MFNRAEPVLSVTSAADCGNLTTVKDSRCACRYHRVTLRLPREQTMKQMDVELESTVCRAILLELPSTIASPADRNHGDPLTTNERN